MKPTAVVLVLALGAWTGGAPAAAQAPPQPTFAPEPIAPDVIGDHFGPCPPPWAPKAPPEFPDAFLWDDYRGACIEHDLYRPRYLAPPPGGAECSRPVLFGVGAWLDSLVAWMPFHRSHVCYHCGPESFANEAIDPPLSPAPSYSFDAPRDEPLLTPVPPPDHGPGLVPVQPRLVTPVPVEPTESASTGPAPIDPEPSRPARVHPAMPNPLPVQPLPPQPVPPPRVDANRPPPNLIPPRLIPPRTPIVELAPELAHPIDPPAAQQVDKPLPRNRVPRPSDELPRNAVPRPSR